MSSNPILPGNPALCPRTLLSGGALPWRSVGWSRCLISVRHRYEYTLATWAPRCPFRPSSATRPLADCRSKRTGFFDCCTHDPYLDEHRLDDDADFGQCALGSRTRTCGPGDAVGGSDNSTPATRAGQMGDATSPALQDVLPSRPVGSATGSRQPRPRRFHRTATLAGRTVILLLCTQRA